MKLKSVQVKNFRCIEDSTEFSACPVTCLVGKNGAGKTAILEALYKVNPDVKELGHFDVLMDYPRARRRQYQQRAHERADDGVVTRWELEDHDVVALEKISGAGCVKSRLLTVRKGYYPGRKWSADIAWNGTTPDPTEETSAADLHSGLLEKHLGTRLPTFLYFSKWHMMPGRLSLSALIARTKAGELTESDRVFLALLTLGGTNPEMLCGVEHSEELIADLEDAALPITDEIARYWSQEKGIRVSFNMHFGKSQDSAPFNEGVMIFETRIVNTRTNVSLNFEERSTGFVWFFSFLVWYSQVREHHGDNLVIVLDDPGIGLHAKAQWDLLRFIAEKLEPNHQVFYVTHSPFMVDPQKLAWVRTVEDSVETTEDNRTVFMGTRVGDGVVSTDHDTLLPLKASLGYRVLRSVSRDRQSLMVEKAEDVITLRWFSSTLKEAGRTSLDSAWTVMPCGDLVHLASLVGLLSSGAMNFTVLMTLPPDQRDMAEQEVAAKLLKTCHALTLSQFAEAAESTLEDLIGSGCYFSLTDACYKISRKYRTASKAPHDDKHPVLRRVEDHFRRHESELGQFDGMRVAEFLMAGGRKRLSRNPQFPAALDRFEALFKEVNACLA